MNKKELALMFLLLAIPSYGQAHNKVDFDDVAYSFILEEAGIPRIQVHAHTKALINAVHEIKYRHVHDEND